MDQLRVEAGIEQLLIGQPARVQKGRERFVEIGQVPGVEDDTLRVNFHVPDREGKLEYVCHRHQPRARS